MQETPILSALVQMAGRLKLPLHVPGHKQGRVLPAEFSRWVGAAAKLDLTELPGLDNLFQPSGCIAESQALAARHYGSEQCLYSVNGSTAGIIASILACAKGGHVLFLGPFHQSAWRGLVMADARPIFGAVAWDEQRWTTHPPCGEDLRKALRAHPNISAVYVTSPTYAGVVSPIAELAQVAHEFGLPLIVDEAHGAHFGLAPELPQHSVSAGADLVIQSTHKMLPALTQTAWVHRQGNRVRARSLEEALKSIQSTSPSYLLLASLDVTQAWLRTEGAAAATDILHVLAPLHPGQVGCQVTDPFRHWIPTGNLEMSTRIQSALAERGIFVEYADALGVLSIFGFGTRSLDVERYLEIVRTVPCELPSEHAASTEWRKWVERAQQPELVATPREVFMAETEVIPLSAAFGRVCAGLITPYPPGVPMIYPGQLLDAGAVNTLQLTRKTGAEIHGLSAEGEIAVICRPAD